MTPLIWCGDWATSVPILGIGPATISLAGLALPALVASLCWRGLGPRDLPRCGWLLLLAAWLANAGAVAFQNAAGWPGGGAHLVPLPLLWFAWDAWQQHRGHVSLLAGLIGLRRVVGLTFFGMLIPDLAAGVLLHIHLLPDGAPLWGLQYVGGGGWHDGLLIALLAAALGWLAFHLMMRRPEQVAA